MVVSITLGVMFVGVPVVGALVVGIVYSPHIGKRILHSGWNPQTRGQHERQAA